jgi:hypothetical protein
MNDVNEAVLRLIKDGKLKKQDYSKIIIEAWNEASATVAPQEAVNVAFQKCFNLHSLEYSNKHPVYTCHQIYFGQVK